MLKKERNKKIRNGILPSNLKMTLMPTTQLHIITYTFTLTIEADRTEHFCRAKIVEFCLHMWVKPVARMPAEFPGRKKKKIIINEKKKPLKSNKSPENEGSQDLLNLAIIFSSYIL